VTNESTNRTGSSLAGGDLSRILSRLQERIGYQFDDINLLNLALTHKSLGKQNNERLEFIGDAVLGYLVGVMLYHKNTTFQEDTLTLMRAKLVRGTSLAEIAREIDLPPCIRLGSGERKSGGRQRDSILADTLEAVIGAVHEDAGIEACQTMVDRLFRARIEQIGPENLKDAKTLLQEYLQGLQLPLPTYEVTATSGADHAKLYSVCCEVPQLDLRSEGSASSRRGAETAAAKNLLSQIKEPKVDE